MRRADLLDMARRRHVVLRRCAAGAACQAATHMHGVAAALHALSELRALVLAGLNDVPNFLRATALKVMEEPAISHAWLSCKLLLVVWRGASSVSRAWEQAGRVVHGSRRTGERRPERASAMPSFCFCASLTFVTCRTASPECVWHTAKTAADTVAVCLAHASAVLDHAHAVCDTWQKWADGAPSCPDLPCNTRFATSRSV